MGANYTIAQQQQQIRKRWVQLWLLMADNDPGKYKEVKAINVSEFWSVFDEWHKNVKQRLNRNKKA